MLKVLCTRWAPKRSIQLGNIYPCTRTFPSQQSFFNSSSVSLKKNESVKNVESLQKNGDFKIIYKFPYIKSIRGVCRLKIYQTVITFVAVPVVSYMNYLGMLTSDDVTITVSVSGFAFLMLYVMGELFRKVIGHIYYCSQKDLVKISHLTFWGGRQDIIVPREDLVPFSDTSEFAQDIYIRVNRYSELNKPLYLTLRFGGIQNLNSFTHIFGELEQ